MDYMYTDFQSFLDKETDQAFNTVTSTKRLHGTFLRTIIIVLYVLLTIVFATNWAFACRAFIEYSYNYYSMFSALTDGGPLWRAYYLVSGITGGISTLLVDVTMVRQPI